MCMVGKSHGHGHKETFCATVVMRYQVILWNIIFAMIELQGRVSQGI